MVKEISKEFHFSGSENILQEYLEKETFTRL
jgi:hypothetical protein